MYSDSELAQMMALNKIRPGVHDTEQRSRKRLPRNGEAKA